MHSHEARAKAAELPQLRFHMIGQIQTKKANHVARWAASVHSLDSLKLAHALETRREFSAQAPLIDQAGASAAELDLIFDRSLALAEQAHQRLVSLVKLLGTGGLIGIAVLVTMNIYQFVAGISVTI